MAVLLRGLDTAEELLSPGADLVFQSGRTDSRIFPIKFMSCLWGKFSWVAPGAGGFSFVSLLEETGLCTVLHRMHGQPKERSQNWKPTDLPGTGRTTWVLRVQQLQK